MNSRWMRLKTMSSLFKFSPKTKLQVLETLQITRRNHRCAYNSRATFITAAAAAEKPIESTESDLHDNNTVTVYLPQIGEAVFPTVWLRDNCQCPQCFHRDSQSRIIDLLTFDPNVASKNITAQDNILSITWEDGHQSWYSYNWLAERSFNPQTQKKWLTDVYRTERVPWTAKDFNNMLFKTSYDSVMTNDDQLKSWLETLSKYGVAVITKTPKDITRVRQLAQRIGFIRRTHYGEEYDIKAKPGTTNTAYLSANLQLHTDLPYYHYKPGVNLLHCLVQASGAEGENLLTDVLAVSEELRNNEPEAFSSITKTVVDWNDIGHENGNYFHKIHREPVVSLDRWGNMDRVNFSQPQRDSHFSVPIEQVTPWYKAMAKFVAAIYSDKFCVKYKMEPGEILTFDNNRLVHGRSPYTESSNRHVLGAFLDWDEVQSRLRVLKNC